ncbi:D-ribose transport system ATP-binding protein [Streptomyces lincolnensis]|uniref:D-ribose transport system ATP-binding protein n=1 Tax=Streptomyces lincolnensis TaxID=1915 RepID=A0A1B1M6G3_STRLN|nr:sugar ABC transporter ATP-binding protein [Streptomyces lincolnensis]ANS64104.1 D-ribose transport system ATP-binding protein [Streptomyces lincolnensis]AXG57686.1 D-ribose transport system ATP-binding protein [Streptomyces lincolnensis]QMV05942.1 ATP-binding cassette domain-containing protein [Streptomyces lincolnensis]
MSPTETGESGESGKTGEAGPAVSLTDVSMAFGGKTVLASVSLDIAPGSVVALLGANGAGKSTLIKILSGVHTDHGGQVRVDGVPVSLNSPLAARQLGIQTVHQRISEGIVPGLSVAENLVFEELAQRRGNPFLNGGRLLARAREIQAGLGLDWSDTVLRRDVTELDISDRQLLILARALATRPRLLILDEPTSALSAAEAERLFALVERMRDDGIAVLYVSHRLGEIDALADRLVVLRDGRLTEDQTKPFDWGAALRAMLAQAQEATTARPVREKASGDVVVSLRGVRLFEGRAPLDLDLRTGEVTGVVGLLGAGKTELARGLFGAEPFGTGAVTLDGRPYAPRRPADAIRAGVHLVPEDRHADALVPGWSVAQNISLPFLKSLSKAGLVQRSKEDALGRATIDALGVVARDEHSTVEELSGGNQQKVVVGRWLAETPRVLILDEPFRGVDIGARRDIGRRARALAAEGAAVLVLSADVDEVLEVADRVVVLAAGEIHLDAHGEDAERDRVIQTISASV